MTGEFDSGVENSTRPLRDTLSQLRLRELRTEFEIVVPEGLYAVSNGRLEEIREGAPDWFEPKGGAWRTFEWEHPYPLETYSVTLNVAPYEVIETATMTAAELRDVRLLARVQELVANSGRMPRLLRRVHGDAPFSRMRALARHLQGHFGRLHAIGLEPLFDGVVDWLARFPGAARAEIERDALQDYAATGASGRLAFMARGLAPAARPPLPAAATPLRQARRLRKSFLNQV